MAQQSEQVGHAELVAEGQTTKHSHAGGLTTLTFGKVGILVVEVNTTLVLLAPTALTIQNVRCYAKTVPSGAAIIVDINKNGVTIFTTQANRPRILAGLNKGASSQTPDVTSLVEGDELSLDIDQIGSTVAGAGLTVEVRCQQ